MSAPFTENPIKLEENTENVTEIQSYLAGFQKEIGGDSSINQGSGNFFYSSRLTLDFSNINAIFNFTYI